MQAGWLTDLTKWLLDLVKALFADLVELLKDLIVYSLEAVLELVKSIIAGIPVPDLLTNTTICGLLNSAGPTAAWVMGVFHVPQGMALIAGAIVFRLVRKFVTLFQW